MYLNSFSNSKVALRIYWTVYVVSLRAKRSFPKLKILKNFKKNSLSLFKLTDWAIIAKESGLFWALGTSTTNNAKQNPFQNICMINDSIK